MGFRDIHIIHALRGLDSQFMLIVVVNFDVQNFDFLKFREGGRGNQVAGVTGIHQLNIPL